MAASSQARRSRALRAAAHAATAVADYRPAMPDGEDRWRGWWVALVAALVVLPVLAGAAGQLFAVGGDYSATGDLADIELHTRDVGHHQVELGQYSRGDWSHPGPAQFYAMATPYRLLGSTSAAMNAAAGLINASALVGVLLIASRRGGIGLLSITAVALAVLLSGLGPLFLVDPWNPSLPVLPFALFVFLAWDVACGGRWSIAGAAAVGTFCMQTHVGYAPLVGALGVASLVPPVVSTWRSRDRPGGDRAMRWPFVGAAAVLMVLWLPPAIQELRSGEGNLQRVARYFVDGDGEEHSLRDGWANVAVQLSPTPEWVTGDLELTPFTAEPDLGGSAPVPVLLLPVALGGVVWWRTRRRDPILFVGVGAVTLVLSVLAVSRTLGPIYHYRLGFTRVAAMAVVVGALWAAWMLAVQRWPRSERGVLVPAALLVLAALAATGVPRFARTGPPMEEYQEPLATLVARLEAELPEGDGAVVLRCDGDESCIYLAGLVLWFERRGVDARVDNPVGVVSSGAPHRVYRGGPVRAVLHVGIDAGFYARALAPGSKVLATVGDRATEERARLGREILALDADYAAGRITAEEHFFERSEGLEEMGAAVGVVLESLDAPAEYTQAS